MPKLSIMYSHHAEQSWPDHLTANDRHRIGQELTEKLLASPQGVAVRYRLFEDLRLMDIPDAALTFIASIDGVNRDDFRDPQPHWYNGIRLAQFMADALVEYWLKGNNRSVEELHFSLYQDDDGPRETFLTHTLTIEVALAAEKELHRLSKKVERLEEII